MYCPGAPEVVDSWLVDDGRIRDLTAHVDRFTRSTGLARGLVVEHVLLLLEELPQSGRWFPRIELCGGHVHTRTRPAPPVAHTATLVTHGPDPRRRPTVKGPDFPLQERLRTAARAAGADDALLTDPDGHVVESVFGSVLWWQDGSLVVPRTSALLPSVTRAAVLDLENAPVRRADLRPDQLRDADEVWLLSALHGIRTVVAVDGSPMADDGRRDHWQRRLVATARPIDHWRQVLTNIGARPTERTSA
ncbi:aminotransferase class IV [Cellulomonas sp. URHD0024]|uniref:aminotransferase class IV n=1 Tax=Cellulomonas sp. URHD0024 TaxID=1302620 RepID=UPI0004021355|nr:aminotransferase class IV [Cellulomonas sp. URHD0024]